MAPSVIAISQCFPVRLSVIVSVSLLIVPSCPTPPSRRARERHEGRPLDPHVRAHGHVDLFVVRTALEHDRSLLGECAIEIDGESENSSKRRHDADRAIENLPFDRVAFHHGEAVAAGPPPQLWQVEPCGRRQYCHRVPVTVSDDHDAGELSARCVNCCRGPRLGSEPRTDHLERRPLTDEELADLGDHNELPTDRNLGSRHRRWQASARALASSPSISSMALSIDAAVGTRSNALLSQRPCHPKNGRFFEPIRLGGVLAAEALSPQLERARPTTRERATRWLARASSRAGPSSPSRG